MVLEYNFLVDIENAKISGFRVLDAFVINKGTNLYLSITFDANSVISVGDLLDYLYIHNYKIDYNACSEREFIIYKELN